MRPQNADATKVLFPVGIPILQSSGIWVGSQIVVGCIQNLWQIINPGELKIRLIRPAVDKSICVINNLGDPIKFKLTNDEVELHKPREDKTFVGFRPWLTMKVIDFLLETDEWGTSSGWKLTLEEI
ncbi:MAG: hypothetical protein LBF44_02105 [Holosporaceae bacterium]|nr:hypothetical protein [Holosporaceae bacterium]